MNSSNKSPTYFISYGLGGGPWHSRAFRRLLGRSGYQLSQVNEADIIIAHSAGCWLIPPTAKPKLVIYVGMPLAADQPGRTLTQANLASLRHGRLPGSVAGKLKNIYYWLRQPRRNLAIAQHPEIGQPVYFDGVPAVFLANHYDPWPKSEKLADFMDDHPWAFISLAGAHDDIWQHPEPYIRIIEAYARLLA